MTLTELISSTNLWQNTIKSLWWQWWYWYVRPKKYVYAIAQVGLLGDVTLACTFFINNPKLKLCPFVRKLELFEPFLAKGNMKWESMWLPTPLALCLCILIAWVAAVWTDTINCACVCLCVHTTFFTLSLLSLYDAYVACYECRDNTDNSSVYA